MNIETKARFLAACLKAINSMKYFNSAVTRDYSVIFSEPAGDTGEKLRASRVTCEGTQKTKKETRL